MFEKSNQPLLSNRRFILRFLRSVLLGSVLIVVSLFIGMEGYHTFEQMSWPDSFVNAAMILSGMGPLKELVTKNGKLFAGFYALFSGLIFILIIGMIYAPVVHRFFHKFHLMDDEKK